MICETASCDAGGRGVDPELGMLGRLVRSVDPGEALDLARACARVEALGISPLAFLDGRVDEHLDERQVGLLVRLAQVRAIGRQRRDQRDHRDRSGVRHQPRHLSDAADVLGAVARREPEILGQPVSDVVAVEQVRRLAAVDETAFELDRDRRLARRRQPGEQHGRAALVDRQPALVAVERRRVPGDVAAALARRPRSRARVRITPAATVSLLSSSIRMNAPVTRLTAYGSATTGELVRSVTWPMSLSASERRLELALERLRVGPLDDLLDGGADRAGGVLERVAPAWVQRLLAHPADRAVELARGRRLVVGRRRACRRGRRRAGRRART